MASNQQIMSDIRMVMEAEHTLELMNTYKGIPFICKAKVTNIEGDVISLWTRDPAILCMKTEKQTKVLGSDYFEPSVASVVSVDVSTGTVVLSNFTYSGTKLGERMVVRVHPAGLTEVGIESATQEITGELIDLSLSGMGVKIKQAEYSLSLKPGTSIQISLPLPNGQVLTNGTILSADKMGEHYRLAVRFTQEVQNRTTIFKYLIDRRAEIEQELRQEHEKALQGTSSR